MKIENLKICNICGSEKLDFIDKNYNICQCKDCGYIFDNPRPTTDEITNFYSQFDKYDSWLAEEKGRDLMWQRFLKRIKKYKKTGALLDVGTGIGQFLYFAKNDFKVKGTEVSDSAIRIAKQKYGIDLIKGEIENINFGGSKFDIITIVQTLEHLPNPSSTIKRCRELLNEKGIIIIAVPNDIFSIKVMVRYLLSIFKIGRFKNRGKFGLPKITLDGSRDEIHLSHFTAPVLKTLFIKNGFTVIKNGLDPFYVPRKYWKIIDGSFYLFCLLIRKIFGVNLYNNIWIAAKVYE